MTETPRPDDALRQLIATPQGRAVLWQILSWSGVHQNPFTGDQAGTYFNCGRQNVGQQITGWLLETAPSFYAMMYKERSDEPSSADTNPDSDTHSGTGPDSDPNDYSLTELYPVPGRRNTEGSGEW